MLNLRSSSKDDKLKVFSFLLGNVSSLEGSSTTLHVVNGIILVHVLTREDKGGRTVLVGDGTYHSGNSLLGITGSPNIKIGEYAKTGNGLNGLMGGSILTDSDRIVCENVRNTVELSKGSNTDGRTEVINEYSEGRSGSLEDSVVGNSVKNGSHGMLTDSEVKILSGVSLVE